jgi:hypothetical protein
VRAEPLDPADDGGTGEPVLTKALDDRRIERFAVPRVRLADEDPEQLARAFEFQIVLPTTTPR